MVQPSPLRYFPRLQYPQPSCGPWVAEDGVLTPSRDPAGNSSLRAQASATLKRVAPLIAKVDAKHRRTSSYSAPGNSGGSGGGGNSHGAALFAGRSRGTAHEHDSDRLLRERLEGLALETEQLRASRERAETSAAADMGLDEAFLNSFGVSLNETAGAGAGSGVSASRGDGTSPPAFDCERLISRPLGSMAQDTVAGAKTEDETRTARRKEAAATLSAAEFQCWEIREEIDRYRRQDEKIRSQIFNGDPLLPLWDGPGGGGE